MTKPDDRSDNVEKLQEMTQNTLKRFHEAEEYLELHADEMNPEQVEQMQAKNERRLESVRGFREEIKDEVSDH
ncbi:small, acid-soluble spore protein Tlp [Insulibacter thermoxylanivorax]|uniref:Small, acid-soluble spore protein Tlp n=1 Tax=Insulibacter thermoxylanivorax TaxID=2749268 RepID=A0A916QCL2_9BACL|nr:small acid-soluble spore protein Tlp [Insulibacter thermoxylanivorax]GFR38275.1 small, acid-soluble spore protein Tlp [Insulibacter thermoxylanivorax]